jgi:hypothetical protein
MISYGKIVLAFLLATPATAQQWVGVHAGIVNYAEGIFSINDELLQLPDARFRKIPEGASLRTGSGWVEIQLGPNAFLWMGENGSLRMESADLTNTQLLVEQGSVIIYVFEQIKGNRIKIRMGDTVTEPKQAGLYRLDSDAARLSVYQGKAEISLAGKKAAVKSGKSAVLSGNLKTAKFDLRKTDLLQENALRRSQLLYKEIREARLRNNPGRSGPPTGEQLAMPDGVMDRLEQERLYQDMQNVQQTRPAAAGPHPQPWEPSQVIQQQQPQQ